MRWSQITLRQFQFIDGINKSTDFDDLDKVMHTACILFNHTENSFAKAGKGKALRMIDSTTRLFLKPFPGTHQKRIGRYLIQYNIDQITFGQYVELTHFLQKTIDNAGQILASVASPILGKNDGNKHRQVSEYFLNKSVTVIIHAVKRVADGFDKLNKEYEALFEGGETISDSFNNQYGWIYSATAVAEHEGITLEQAFSLPVRQALNDLSFLKSKRQYDEMMIKKQRT